MNRWVLAGGVVAGAVALHAAPALTAIAPLRRGVLPKLSGVGRADHVALTFDDGPDRRSTPAFLDVLAARRLHATFFVLGAMASRAQSLTREIAQAGHEIAVHGWHHGCLLTRTPSATYDDLARARDLVAGLTGRQPRWFRPPYGVLTSAALRAARRLDLTPVLWTAWGRDWQARATPESVLATVRAALSGGGTVLLHDSDSTSAPGSWRASLAALEPLIDDVLGAGLGLGPLAEHGV